MSRDRLKKAYGKQESSARARGIEWRLTFEEWLAVWTESGHLEQRGRRKGEYVMSRPADQGPYAVGNVCIVSNAKNLLEARTHAQPRGGVYLQLPGSAKPWCAKFARKHIGYYATEEEAQAARSAAMAAAGPKKANAGVPKSEDHKAKLRAAALRIPRTEAQWQKMSDAIKAGNARRRERLNAQ